jgi:WD40 repeat protein
MKKHLQITFYLLFITLLSNGQGQQIIDKPVQTFNDLPHLKIVGLDFHPNGKKLVATTPKFVREYTLNEPNNEKGRLIINFKNALLNCNNVAYSPNGNMVAMANRNWTATINRVSDKREVIAFKGHCNAVNAVAFSKNDKWVATASDDLRAKIWNIETGATIHNLIGHQGWVTDIAFSSDSRFLVTVATDAMIKIWDTTTGKLVKTLENSHKGAINAVCFSPDNKWIATASDDNTAIIWDWKNNRPYVHLQGSFFDVNDVAFSASSDYLVTGSDDGIARIWSIETGSEKANLIGHQGSITCLAVSSDGQHIATGSTDKTIKIWQVNFSANNPFQAESITWETRILDMYRPYPTNQSEISIRLNIMSYSPITKKDLKLSDGLGNVISLDYNNHLSLVRKEMGQYIYSYEGKIRLSAIGEYILSFTIDNGPVKAYSKAVKIQYYPKKPTLHVLAIGPSYVDLAYTQKDAEDFADIFKNQKSLYDKINLMTLVGTDATAKNIEAAIDQLKTNFDNGIIKPHDLVIVFFSGHGFPGDVLYLRGHHGERQNTPADFVSFDKFREMEAYIKCKKFIFVDACHSGLADQSAADSETDGGIKDWFRYCDMETAPKGFQLREAQRKLLKSSEGWMLMSSSDGKELSNEYEGFQNGIFTEALLLGLGEFKADVNGNGLVSIDELFNFVQQQMPELCKNAAKKNQTPGINNNLDDLEFFSY